LQFNYKGEKVLSDEDDFSFYFIPDVKGGESMSPIDLFKAGVAFGLSIYMLLKEKS
jgi:hypothetical protein